MDLVNIVLPQSGDTISTKDYRAQLQKMGYNFYQQIGSIGGAKAAGTITINNLIMERK